MYFKSGTWICIKFWTKRFYSILAQLIIYTIFAVGNPINQTIENSSKVEIYLILMNIVRFTNTGRYIQSASSFCTSIW